MSEPLVAAIMLTRDRPAMARRAVECFQRQSYENKWLIVMDQTLPYADFGYCSSAASATVYKCYPGSSIGDLRNSACGNAARAMPVQVFVHFDDDDWSHPDRIAEQVALLQASGADAVGYREMLFWDSTKAMIEVGPSKPGPDGKGALGIVKSVGEAWLYSSQSPKPYALGTSLCYWRKTWEAKPFPEVIQPHDPAVNWGEDYEWCRGLKIASISSCPHIGKPEPRMIASIHGGNTSPAYAKLDAPEWTRVPQWDAHCRSVMAL